MQATRGSLTCASNFGLLAITLDLAPASAEGVLPQARAAWEAGRYGEAQIHFKRALQAAPRDAKVHEELARLYADWAAHEPTKRAELRAAKAAAKQAKQSASEFKGSGSGAGAPNTGAPAGSGEAGAPAGGESESGAGDGDSGSGNDGGGQNAA